MLKCTHNDCYTCPYADCISDRAPKSAKRSRRKLSPEELKRHKAESWKKYYNKKRDEIQAAHRDYYARKRRKSGD